MTAEHIESEIRRALREVAFCALVVVVWCVLVVGAAFLPRVFA